MGCKSATLPKLKFEIPYQNHQMTKLAIFIEWTVFY